MRCMYLCSYAGHTLCVTLSSMLTKEPTHKPNCNIHQGHMIGENMLWLQGGIDHDCGLNEYMQWCCGFTQWDRDKMAAISQKIFSNVFSWIKTYQFRLKYHCKKCPINNILVLVELTAPTTQAIIRINVAIAHDSFTPRSASMWKNDTPEPTASGQVGLGVSVRSYFPVRTVLNLSGWCKLSG